MKLSRVFILIAIHTTNIVLCDTTLIVSPQKSYIASAVKEWAHTHLPTLDPYQLQLLTSNLNLLCDQAVHITNAEKMKQRILYSTRELIDANNTTFLKTIPTDCDQYTQLFALLNDTNNALQICTQHIEALDQSYREPLQKSLEVVAEIGRTALTYHDEELAPQTQKIIDNVHVLLNELQQHDADLKTIDTIDYQEYTRLAQFYALQNITAHATNKAWKIIALNMVNTLAHVTLIHTCSLVFESCFELANERLMNQEVPAQYRRLLFVPNAA